MPLNRRQLLQALSASTFVISLGKARATTAYPAGGGPGRVSFPQGVASADPQPHSVVLWTRAEPVGGADRVALQVQISDHESFEQVLWARDLEALTDSDYTVRAQVQDLEPGRTWFYRFVTPEGDVSRTGRTLTAPAPDRQEPLRLAFVSCQNFENNHYGAWARLLADDLAAAPRDQLQVVLHLGDFIYERCWNGLPDGRGQFRTVPPFPDGAEEEDRRHAVSLADYRHLYKTYLGDPHLQAARARWPFICTWDDHEFSNDNFQSYSTYGGRNILEAARKLNANRAWFEFIPAALDELVGQPSHGYRVAELTGEGEADNAGACDSLRIYRTLAWGSAVDLVLTDTRSYRSGPCLPDDFASQHGLPLTPLDMVQLADAGRAFNNGQPPARIRPGETELDNPWRDREPGSCLGPEQRQWFLDTLGRSRATWKLWGNSLPLLPLRLDLSAIPLAGYRDSLLTLDPWAGYPHEQALLMDSLRAAGVTGLVSLSGDHHLHGVATVAGDPADDAPVAVDFAVAGISSTPMYADLLREAGKQPAFLPLVQTTRDGVPVPNWHLTLLQGCMAAFAYDKTGVSTLARWFGPNQANRGLRFVDCLANGYGLAHFSATELAVEMVTLDGMDQPFEQPPPVAYRAGFRLPAWSDGGSPQLEGPFFDGPPPFPFDTNPV